MSSTTMSSEPVTITRPSHACLLWRRLPRRNAAASPTTLRLSTNGMSVPSTSVMATARSQ
jgi:hypothetical protein